jgi:hypothetical protein
MGLTKEEIKERQEHQQCLEDIRAILSSKAGRSFAKYLLKNLDVGELPEMGLSDGLLADRLGFLRAGNSIYKLMSEADHYTVGIILSEIEKEKLDEKLKSYLQSDTE